MLRNGFIFKIIRSNTSPTVSGDADVWREFFTASEREMKEQLMSEIVNMRQVIAMLESQKAQLVNQVAQELGTTVDFKMVSGKKLIFKSNCCNVYFLPFLHVF